MSSTTHGWVTLAVVGTMVATSASAHPMSRDRYSLRTAAMLSGDHLDAIVLLEVPMDVVTTELRGQLSVVEAQADARETSKAIVAAYAKQQWDKLAAGLTLHVDGAAVAGSWQPRDDRFNGKGAVSEGFFLYIVEFRPTSPLVFDGDVTVTIDNVAYPDAPMVYSAYVVAGEGWSVASSSAAGVLPDRPYDLNDPAFWVEDASLRHVKARFVAKP